MSTYPNRASQPDIRLNARGRLVAAIGVAAVTAIAAFPSVGRNIGQEVARMFSSGPSVADLSKLPTRDVVIPGGSGPDYAISKVDPQAFNDGEVLSELEGMIKAQAPDGVLQPGEAVTVPVLPQSAQ